MSASNERHQTSNWNYEKLNPTGYHLHINKV